MSQSLQDLLATLFGHWRKVAEETVSGLGEEPPNLFVYLSDDILEIDKAICNAYPEKELWHSLVYIEFTGLLNELNWLLAHFLCGNYRLVQSQLRFNWERIFRARYADAYAEDHPGASDGPGPSLDDKHGWLTQREDKLDWRRLIAPTLARLFPAGVPAAIESHFKPLWNRLNRCVHPSGELREKLVGESALHLRAAFDESWARETLTDAAEVFGLIYLAVISRFPAVAPPLLADPETFRACPQLRAVLERATAAG